MKHKKLFAILTLVCFMFTLMPVAAMATEEIQKVKIDLTDDYGLGSVNDTEYVFDDCLKRYAIRSLYTGYTSTASDKAAFTITGNITSEGDFTIGNEGKRQSSTLAVVAEKSGENPVKPVNIENVDIKAEKVGAAVYLQAIDAPITMKNVVVDATNAAGITLEFGKAGLTLDNVTVTQDGAGYGQGYEQKSWLNTALGTGNVADAYKESTITVNSGTYTSKTGSAVTIFSSGGKVVINDGTFSGVTALNASAGTIEVNGGTFTGDYQITGDATLVIKGGTFSVNPTAYVNPETHVVIDNGNGTYDVKVIVPVGSITVTPATVEVTVDAETQLSATVNPANPNGVTTNTAVTWKSSDDTIATVDENGKVKGIAAGSATITATSDADTSKSATCTVTVKAATNSNPGTSAPVGGVYIPSGSTSSTPKVETETTVTPNGTKVETTTETTKDGTVIETVTTTTASGETTTTVTSTLDNGSAVTNNDAAVEVEVDEVSYATLNKAEEAVKADETVDVVGDKDNAISVSASNAATGAAQTDFAQPMSVSVPVDNAVLNNVEDTSKLTLAKVVTNADGTTELVYMGGSYDEETGTFNAKVDEAGDYILVEKDDLVKIELTIGDTTVKHNDKHHELDVAPAINAEAGRTELPLRYLGEALGFGIDWNNNVVTITKDGVSFSLTIGVEIPGYGTPYIENDRTMVSARYISEMLGANVIWDPVDRQVIVVK